MSDPWMMDTFIKNYLQRNGGEVAWGGYREIRNLYKNNLLFESNTAAPRNIHLGVDFWTTAGTKVIAPLDGEVHSFRNNNEKGDYGPTILLKHNFMGFEFYTLYGHLSRVSLTGLFAGKTIKTGDLLGSLGKPDENVNYAPHLHFQLIVDMQGYKGDYPGVCNEAESDFYFKNCPDPRILLKL